MANDISIRECVALDELQACVDLQREVFALPEVELSPVRHFVVTKNAGGFTLGAYHGDRLAGFVLSVPAFLRGEQAFYSHMTGVRVEYQSLGIGAKLKWAQRIEALERGVKYIKWTFEPAKARNAFFNLEKLGAVISEYQRNFYGTDYAVIPGSDREPIGLQSDRLFCEWHLESEKVTALAAGEKWNETREPIAEIVTVNDWNELVTTDPGAGLALQLRLREGFEDAFSRGLVAEGFRRDEVSPSYLLY